MNPIKSEFSHNGIKIQLDIQFVVQTFAVTCKSRYRSDIQFFGLLKLIILFLVVCFLFCRFPSKESLTTFGY